MPESSPVRRPFIYNADSGLFNTLADIGHKLFSPETYACRLCAITYGLLTEKAEWREFVDRCGVRVLAPRFVDRKLFPYLHGFRQRASGPDAIKYNMGEIFGEIKNKIRSGYNLREIIDHIDELCFRSQAEKHELYAEAAA